jgi:hypothetical protein
MQTIPLWSQAKLVFGSDMNGVREINAYKKVAHNKNTKILQPLCLSFMNKKFKYQISK